MWRSVSHVWGKVRKARAVWTRSRQGSVQTYGCEALPGMTIKACNLITAEIAALGYAEIAIGSAAADASAGPDRSGGSLGRTQAALYLFPGISPQRAAN